MNNMQLDIGKRLKAIRSEYYAKFKLSIPEFADELGETKHNIANYERGLASIPNRVLVALYSKGIQPLYILTGEGDVYANNEQGRFRSKERDELKKNNSGSPEALEKRLSELTIAAGDILQHLRQENAKGDNNLK